MDEPQWDKPDNFFMTFRCMKQKYGRPFFEKGQIKFSTPRSWVEYAKKYGDGRGDQLEGTLATFDIRDIEHAIPILQKYNSAYNDIEPFRTNSRCYLKKQSDMDLPCLCMYYLMYRMFPCPDKPGMHELQCDIPATYFRDFADNQTPEAIEKTPTEDRPCVVIIRDYPEFKRRVIKTLLQLGISREEIIETKVSYFDFEQYGENGWWDFGQKPPMELAIKHIRFAVQSEGRFIINTKNPEIHKMLRDPVEIGPLTDISQYCDQYFYDGIQVVMHADIERIQ